MENPFKYGSVVTGDDFVDRDSEMRELAREMRAGKSVVIYSSRRMGKTSLLAEFSRRHAKDFIFVRVDLYGMTDQNRLVESLVEETCRSAFGTIDRLTSTVMELLKGTALRFVVTERGEIGVEVVSRESRPADISEAFDIPERVARKRRKRIVVVFDEFQEISHFDGLGLLKLMRSKFQTHANVTYAFSGSKRHVLRQMFEEREGAFFKFARPLELGTIPWGEFQAFLVSRFEAANGRLDEALAARILSVSDGHPYYTQQIAHELFYISKSPSAEDVDRAVMTAVEHQSPAYSFIWETTRSPVQRRYLVAVAKEPSVVHGHEFIARHGLKSASHAQRAVKQLEARGILEDGEIPDPLFATWLRLLGGSVRESP